MQELVKSFNNLPYKEKRDIYSKAFSLGTFNGITNVNDKLILLSLVSLVYLQMKKKKSDISPLDILLNITKQSPDNSGFYQTLETISLMVEELCYAAKTADACGLKNSQEVINKIKEILNSWIPF